jgi:ribosomal protein L37AE/L43A
METDKPCPKCGYIMTHPFETDPWECERCLWKDNIQAQYRANLPFPYREILR